MTLRDKRTEELIEKCMLTPEEFTQAQWDYISEFRARTGAIIEFPLRGDFRDELNRRAQLQKAIPIIRENLLSEVEDIIDFAISSLKYCEEKFGHDDMARLNLEASKQALKHPEGGGKI